MKDCLIVNNTSSGSTSGLRAFYAGAMTSSNYWNFDVKDVCLQNNIDYTTLTRDNFLISKHVENGRSVNLDFNWFAPATRVRISLSQQNFLSYNADSGTLAWYGSSFLEFEDGLTYNTSLYSAEVYIIV